MYKLKSKSLIPLLLCISLLYSNSIVAQTEFFNSKISFSDGQLTDFYSSFSIDSSQVYFNANDYYLHAYNKKTGKLNWSHYVANKSNNTPKIHLKSLFISKHISEYDDKCIQLDTKTGDTIQTLKIESINTQPVFRGDSMFCTAINPEIGGAVLAYDLKKNNIIWQQFIAHGVDRQPHYLKDKIVANAEENNWFELDYDGKLLDTTCKNKTAIFVENIKCIRNFNFLTHDNKEITTLFVEKYFDDSAIKMKSSKTITAILGTNKLLLLGNRKKIKQEIDIEKIITLTENGYSYYKEILKIEGNTIWFFCQNILVVYDYKNLKTLKTYDLTKWNAHRVLLDNNNLWLISRDNGQLVGLELENLNNN